jgi:hypothetical protein
MNNEQARSVLAQLVEAAKDHNAQAIIDHNLPTGTQLALGKLLGIGKEVASLEGLLERKMAEESETEALVLGLLQRLP